MKAEKEISVIKQDQLKCLSVWLLRSNTEPQRERKKPIAETLHKVAMKMAAKG